MNALYCQNKEELLEQFTKRLVSNFLYVIILNYFRKKEFIGHDVTVLIHCRFSILLSSGTIYSTLHEMERQGLLKGYHRGRTSKYKVTVLGKQFINLLKSQEMANLLESMTENSGCL